MLAITKRILPVQFNTTFSNKLCVNNFYYALVVVFNKVSTKRIKLVGPDRACAEWLMRNGALIKWKGSSSYVTHYDGLPLDETIKGVFLLKEVDATNAAISHHGFPHFDGCEYVDKIKFNNCEYLENKALGMLDYLKTSLEDVEITDCKWISDEGLKSLKNLAKLKKLKVGELKKVRNMNSTVDELRKALPGCEITVVEKVVDNKEMKH